MTPKDVLKQWWKQANKEELPTCFTYSDGQIRCKQSGIAWLGMPVPSCEPVPNGSCFNYALRINGPIRSILLADPNLFLKMALVLKKVEHDHNENQC